jgi:hypothetical protein
LVDDHCRESDDSLPVGFGCSPTLFSMLLRGRLLLLSIDRIGFILE